MATRKSFSSEIADIASELNIPKATVERVLRTRLAHQLAALKRGESVCEEGLFTIKVTFNPDTEQYVYRGAVSPALRHVLEGDTENLRLLSNIGV